MDSNVLNLIKNLVDEGSFIELGAMAVSKNHLNDESYFGDGVVTGYATIGLKLVYIYAQNENVADASIGKMHAKKIVNLYKMAIKMGAPIISFIGNSGIRIDEGQDSLFAFGKILKASSKAKGIIPQISVVTGCAGGGSCILCENADFILMEEKNAKMFTIAPNGIPGNADENIANAEHLAANGLVDFYGDMNSIIQKVQELVNILPSNCDNDDYAEEDCTDDLNRLTPSVSEMNGIDLIKNISDNNYILELKQDAGKATKIGFAKFNGQTVGFVTNHSEEKMIGYASIKKVKNFINFLDDFNIPLLTVADVKMFNPKCKKVNELGFIAGKLINAYVASTMPKVTLIKNAYSYAGFMMGSKAIGADVVYAFKNSKIGVIDEKRAVELLYADEIKKADDKNKFVTEKITQYENETSSVYAAAKRDFIDGIIDDEKTRQLVIASFEMLWTKEV